MEPFYRVLHGEIRAFEEHVRRCQKDFDLHTLYQVLLLLLPRSPTWELRSLGQLEKLVEGWDWPGQATRKGPGSAAPCDVPGYVAWLGSYLDYLRALKETFDAKVVFPLCEHLYVHEEPEVEALSPWGLPSSSAGAAYQGQKWPQAGASIAEVAKQLFAGRRKWARLLHGQDIDDHAVSPRSQSILQGFANAGPVATMLRLVPDIFHQSLVTAALARQWLCLHGCSHIHQWCSVPGRRRRGLAPGAPAESGGQREPATSCSPCPRGQPQAGPHSSLSACEGGPGLGRAHATRATVQETHMELLGLLWHAERAGVLRKQRQQLSQSIASLRREQQETQRQLDALQHRLEQAGGAVAGSLPLLAGQCQVALRRLEELGRQLELAEYRHSLLQSDWLLELELRPWLFRQIEAVQQRCQDLEQALQANTLPATGLDSTSRSDSGHCSTPSPLPANTA